MKKAYLLGLLTVFFWSTSATAFKLTLRHLDPFQMLLLSSFTSIVVLGGILVVQGKIKQVWGWRAKEYLACAVLGLLNPLIYYLMIFRAYDLLPAQIAQPVNYTWAIMLSLLSVPLLKHTITRTDVLATIICYSGAVIVTSKGSVTGYQTLSFFGLFLALASTVIWALYWIYNVRLRREPVAGLFLNFLFSFPFILAACLLFSELRPFSTQGILGAIWVGCFEFGFTYVLWITALKLSPSAGKMANLIFLAPFVSLVFIHFLVGEKIYNTTFPGLILIVAGLLIQKRGTTPVQKRTAS